MAAIQALMSSTSLHRPVQADQDTQQQLSASKTLPEQACPAEHSRRAHAKPASVRGLAPLKRHFVFQSGDVTATKHTQGPAKALPRMSERLHPLTCNASTARDCHWSSP
jgi:hypothetical protein